MSCRSAETTILISVNLAICSFFFFLVFFFFSFYLSTVHFVVLRYAFQEFIVFNSSS